MLPGKPKPGGFCGDMIFWCSKGKRAERRVAPVWRELVVIMGQSNQILLDAVEGESGVIPGPRKPPVPYQQSHLHVVDRDHMRLLHGRHLQTVERLEYG